METLPIITHYSFLSRKVLSKPDGVLCTPNCVKCTSDSYEPEKIILNPCLQEILSKLSRTTFLQQKMEPSRALAKSVILGYQREGVGLIEN